MLFPLGQADEGFAGKLAKIEQRIQAEQKPWYQDFHATRSAEEREALLDEVPGREFEAELQALATEARGTEVALQAWTRLFGLAKELRDEDTANRALERITAEHLDSAGLDALCRFIGSWARPGKTAASEAALRKMIAVSPHPAVRAAARFHLAVILAQAETSKPSTRCTRTSICATTAGAWSCCTSGASGEPSAWPCCHATARSWSASRTSPSLSSASTATTATRATVPCTSQPKASPGATPSTTSARPRSPGAGTCARSRGSISWMPRA